MLIGNRESGRKDSEVTNLIDMSELGYFSQFAKRTGMFIGRTSLIGATAFMVGYVQAAQRYGGPGLETADQRRRTYFAPGVRGRSPGPSEAGTFRRSETDELGHSVRLPQDQQVTGSDPRDGLPELRNFCGPLEWAAARSGGNPPARHE